MTLSAFVNRFLAILSQYFDNTEQTVSERVGHGIICAVQDGATFSCNTTDEMQVNNCKTVIGGLILYPYFTASDSAEIVDRVMN